MVCELLVMISITRKLWTRGRVARAGVVALWVTFAVAVRFILAVVELLPRPVVLALPVIGATVAAINVTRIVRRRRSGRRSVRTCHGCPTFAAHGVHAAACAVL